MNFFKTAEAPAEKPAAPKEPEDPPLAAELTAEERAHKKMVEIKSKLKEELRHKPKPGHHFSYEKMFRAAARVLIDQPGAPEGNDGLSVVSSRQTMNMSATSKYHLHNKQNSSWEITLQMHGFSDFVSATYSTLNRYQLMYQRIFKTGAVCVGQWMVQPGMMAPGPVPAGNFFAMFEYPWRTHGCSSVTYLKGQHVSLSHTERLIRGLYVGTTMTYDFNTHATSACYGMQSTSANKKNIVSAEYKDSGDMKLALVRKEWATDSEVALEVDYAEQKNGGKASSLNAGVRKNLIGGGVLNMCLTNFTKVRGMLELPFGLDRPGLNQIRVAYNMSYDIPSSTVKHGLAFTI